MELLLTILLPLLIVVLARPWFRWSRPTDYRLRDAARQRGLHMGNGVLGNVAEGTVEGMRVHVHYIDTQSPPKKDQP